MENIYSIDFFYDLLYIMFLVGLVVFVSLYFVDAGYGKMRSEKWGPAMNNKAGWFLMEAPVFLVVLYLYFKSFAINDGVTMNASHGEWPYESWGINRQDDARMRIDFGREVAADRLILYTRADFPHDNWWEQVSFTFSDGSSLDMKMEKSYKPHEITFEAKKITWLEMHDMKKADDPSPFPALTQIEVYGTEA